MANKAYITAGIESDLHSQITKEAARNKQSFSAQIREYRDYFFAGEEKIIDHRTRIRELEEQVDELRTNNVFLTDKNIDLKEEIRKLTDVN